MFKEYRTSTELVPNDLTDVLKIEITSLRYNKLFSLICTDLMHWLVQLKETHEYAQEIY